MKKTATRILNNIEKQRVLKEMVEPKELNQGLMQMFCTIRVILTTKVFNGRLY